MSNGEKGGILKYVVTGYIWCESNKKQYYTHCITYWLQLFWVCEEFWKRSECWGMNKTVKTGHLYLRCSSFNYDHQGNISAGV